MRHAFAVLALGLALATPQSRASPETEMIADLLKETQFQGGDGATQRLVWWSPTDFWVLTARQAPGASELQIQQVAKLLDRYVMVAVMEGTIGPLGGMTFTAEDALRGSVRLIDGQGRAVETLEADAIDSDTQNFLAMMKPMLSKMLGPFGANVHFVLFPATTKSGARYADPRSESIFHVELSGERFTYRLPLGALLPRKVCPKDGERLNGAWKYCPRHGVELTGEEARGAAQPRSNLMP